MSFAKNSIEYILIVLVSLPGDFVVVSYQFCRVRRAHQNTITEDSWCAWRTLPKI